MFGWGVRSICLRPGEHWTGLAIEHAPNHDPRRGPPGDLIPVIGRGAYGEATPTNITPRDNVLTGRTVGTSGGVNFGHLGSITALSMGSTRPTPSMA